ncbi:DUF2264 domain-containing protein [Actinomycetes bacterium KLBMP 9759]
MTGPGTLAPFTGLARADWLATTDRLLAALRPWASADHATITPPGAPGGYGTRVDGLEGFARSFMGAAFRIAGTEDAASAELAAWYAEGLTAGVDPDNPGRWVRPGEHDQAKVEAAALALGLHLTRKQIWDLLDERTRDRLVGYLAELVGAQIPPINWVWFRIVTQTFLRSVGGPWSRADLDDDLAVHESFVRAEGWFADGPDRSYDHYAGWALHFYPAVWLEMAAGDERAEELRERYRARLDEFLPQAAALVGADGGPLVQGRSLTYRFAAAAPFWAGAITGSTALTPGELRRAASGILRHFLDNGVPDDHGLLPLGWHAGWRPIAQRYSGPGSPYWAFKGMAGLALAADHPVWTAVEEPLPVERGDVAMVVRAPGWLVAGTRADGIVRVVNHGTDHGQEGALVSDSPLYARLGYSTVTSPVLTAPGWDEPLDAGVSLLDERGHASHRAGFRTLTLGATGDAGYGFSIGRAHWVEPTPGQPDHGSGRTGEITWGPEIVIGSIVRGAWEVRLARVEGCGYEPTGPLRVGGWPVAPDGPTSVVVDLGGLPGSGVITMSDATPLSPTTRIPWRASAGVAQKGRWYVAGVLLCGAQTVAASPAVTVTAGRATVIWCNGAETRVDLPELGHL